MALQQDNTVLQRIAVTLKYNLRIHYTEFYGILSGSRVPFRSSQISTLDVQDCIGI